MRVVNCTLARLYQTRFIVWTVSQAGRFQLPGHTQERQNLDGVVEAQWLPAVVTSHLLSKS